MPSLAELTALFDGLPEVPPPVPRVRQKHPTNGGGDKPQGKAAVKGAQSKTLGAGSNVTTVSAPVTYISWFSLWPFRKQSTKQPVKSTPERRPHPMAAIKQGKKVAIIAVVDAGSPSFFRFGQGEFSEWPMVG
jgi:tRNA-splicing endonuclease subunit Sen54